jgi:hypothetical protein
MANTRSRNYPAMSLGEAIERAGILYKREGRAKVDAASAVAAWGYGSLNGASLRVVSALRQYGLLEGSNEELRLSESGLTLLLEPPSSSEYSAALQAALTAPSLYREVLDEYTDGLPSDPAMISYLVRKQGLGEAAAKSVLESFRKSLELIDDHDKQYLAPQVSSNVSANERQAIKPNSLEVKELEQSKPGINLNFAWPLSCEYRANAKNYW